MQQVGAPLRCIAQDSYCSGFFYWRAQARGHTDFSSCSTSLPTMPKVSINKYTCPSQGVKKAHLPHFILHSMPNCFFHLFGIFYHLCFDFLMFDTVYDAFDALRGHSVKNPMCRASVSSVCMHAGSPVADQTTSSMVVELTDTIRIFVTGSSRPCLSVFKPYGFEAGGIIRREGDAGAETYWRKSERRQRKLLGRIIPGAYYAERDALERRLTGNAQHDLEEEAHFYARWAERSFEKGMCAPGFARYREKKNTAFSAFR